MFLFYATWIGRKKIFPIVLLILIVFASTNRGEAAQTVFLDFDTFTSIDGYVYTPADRALIKTGLETIYGPPGLFDLTFTTTPPGGTHSTIYFNFGVGPYGGTSDHVDFLNTDSSDDAYVLTKPLLTSMSIPLTTPNILRASTNIAAHELGHILGLRHYDSFGPPLGGMPAGIAGGFTPAYPGPTTASSTTKHIMSLASSVGLSPGNLLDPDIHLGFREALKLKMAGVPMDFEAPGLTTPMMPQPMSFGSITVPNTMAGFPDADAAAFSTPTFSVLVDVISGTISQDPMAPPGSPVLPDYYSFSGSKDEVLTIEVMSEITAWRKPGMMMTDPVVFLLDDMGLPVGTYFFNDNEYESTDSLLWDIKLPYTGTYIIEVGSVTASPMMAGPYELFVYRYNPIPEPSSLALCGIAISGCLIFHRRRSGCK